MMRPFKLTRINFFLLRLFAFYILERMDIKKPKRNPRLLGRLYTVYEKAGNIECLKCGKCCRGGHGRFTVYDHIAHLMAGVNYKWEFKLYPFRPDIKNYKEGICRYLGNNGCIIPYKFRPYICAMSFCDGKKLAPWKATDEERKTISEVKREIGRIHWRFLIGILSSNI